MWFRLVVWQNAHLLVKRRSQIILQTAELFFWHTFKMSGQHPQVRQGALPHPTSNTFASDGIQSSSLVENSAVSEKLLTLLQTLNVYRWATKTIFCLTVKMSESLHDINDCKWFHFGSTKIFYSRIVCVSKDFSRPILYSALADEFF